MHITIQTTPHGLLVSHPRIEEWLQRGIEIIQEEERLIIQPRSPANSPRQRLRQLLEQAGFSLVADSPGASQALLSPEQFNQLRQKFSQGDPLTDLLLEERATGW